MKKSIYNPGILLFITLFLFSLTLSAEELKKEYHKEYAASASTTLDINNRYGDVVIQSWDNNQIVIDVIITVEHPSKERAEKLLGYIDVEFSEGDNLVKARTIIDENFNFSGWGSDSKKFSIDYNIKMPVKASLTLANKYGNTKINEIDGLVNLDIKYGNINAGKLLRGNIKPINRINVAYGKGTIEEAGWMDLTVRYVGSMNITKSQALLLDSKYSKISLGETSSVVGESKYDNLKIEKISNLILENGYTDTNIGTLTKKLTYKGSYGSFTVNSIPAGFESIEVETRYMGVKLGIDPSANYSLDGKVSYGGLKYNEDNFKVQKRIIENNSNEVSGIVGKEESPLAKVNVSSSYGNIRLFL
jgi:hypothetical protein